MRNEKAKIIIAIIISGLIGYGIGVSMGYGQALDFCVDVGFRLLENNGIDIGLDKVEIYKAVARYKIAIGSFIK